jgi:hypothetical protein
MLGADEATETSAPPPHADNSAATADTRTKFLKLAVFISTLSLCAIDKSVLLAQNKIAISYLCTPAIAYAPCRRSEEHYALFMGLQTLM